MTTAGAGRGGEAPRPSPGTGTRAEAGSSSGTSQTVRPRRPPPGSRAGGKILYSVMLIIEGSYKESYIAVFKFKSREKLV